VEKMADLCVRLAKSGPAKHELRWDAMLAR
jgi:hypothetical protein